MQRRFILLLIVLTAGGSASEAPAPGDWPQYRGPTRDGIVPPGPKLLDGWPKDGPKMLWKSDPLWPDQKGKAGCASVSIAEGRAITYAYIRRKTDKAVLTTKDLDDWGWRDDVPDDLVKKVDEERVHGKLASLKPGPELDAYVTQYISGLDSETGKNFGPWIQRHLTDAKTWTVPWDALKRLAPMRDKESTVEELDGRAAIGASGWSNPVRSFITEKVFKVLDTVICLDTATGKELWRKEFPGASVHLTLDIGPSSTPAIWDGKCYVFGSAGIYCLSIKDGSVVWQAKAKFSHSSPLVMDGAVYVLAPEATAYDAKTGHVLWSQSGLKHTDCSFTKWTHAGKNYLILSLPGGVYDKPQGGVYCLDPADGKQLWHVWASGGSVPVTTGVDSLIMVGGDTTAFKITPEKIEMLWQTKNTGDARGACPVVFQDGIYLAGACHSGEAVRCLDLKTGALKWNPHRFCAESCSPVLADGKIIALPEEDEGSLAVVMYRATTEKFEELGRFNPHAGPGASPSVVDGKLYLRLQEGIACWDITQYGPYLDKTTVTKESALFNFKQADGGLVSADGAIQGLTVTDNSGASQPLKSRLEGTALIVDLHGAAFPLTISYSAAGNLGAKSGPAASFEWKSPRFQVLQCQGNTITLKLDRSVDQDLWKAAGTYAVSGAKVMKVDVDKSDDSVQLTTDKVWKTGEKAVIRYPAAAELPGVLAELSFTSIPGQAAGETPLKEFLVGELRDKIDPAKAFELDTLDKNAQPAAGEKWKLCKEESGLFDLLKHAGQLSNVVAHAAVYVYSDANRKVQLWAGSDDGLQIVVNGKAVHKNPAIRGCVPDSDKVKDVELKEGWNTVVLGISQGQGGWGFCLRIRNELGNGPPSGVRYAAELPNEK